MSSGAILLLVALLTPGPGCGSSEDLSQRPRDGSWAARQRHFEINLVRLDAGLAPLTSHPVFCRLASERAARVAATGSAEVGIPFVSGTTRQIYRLGYQPHDWAQTALILNPGDSLLERWLELKPESYSQSVTGDYLHLGIGLDRRADRPVWAVFFALPKRVAEWRQAEPLRDLEWVRREILAEVNRLRAERDLRRLTADPRLDRAAQAHAEDLLAHAYYSHQGRDGSTGRQRAAAAGRRSARVISENIAKGPFDPREVVQRWMNSRGHRRNILAPGISEMGVGVAFGENPRGFEVLWVQMFAG